MCLEDICPEILQKYLSDKYANGKIESYLDYKDAIDNYFYEEKRWTRVTRGKANMVTTADDDNHDHDHDQAPEQEYGIWDIPSLAELGVDDCCKMAVLGELNALIKGGIGKKGKGKGKGGKGYGNGANNNTTNDDRRPRAPPGKGPSPMDVDTRLCYECGQEGHIGKNCPVRQARIAAGGPAILPKGKGKGKSGKGQPPSAQQSQAMYPGPSPAQWGQWRPSLQPAAPVSGVASLFQSPHQLSAVAMQSLFTGGSAYALSVKRAPEKAPVKIKNSFAALEEAEQEYGPPARTMTVPLEAFIKPGTESKAKSKKKAETYREADAKDAMKMFTSTATSEGAGVVTGSPSSTPSSTTTATDSSSSTPSPITGRSTPEK